MNPYFVTVMIILSDQLRQGPRKSICINDFVHRQLGLKSNETLVIYDIANRKISQKIPSGVHNRNQAH